MDSTKTSSVSFQSERSSMRTVTSPRTFGHDANPFRYEIALLSVVSIGLVNALTNSFLCSQSSNFKSVGGLIASFIAVFGYEWTIVHAHNLTRRRRAHFDESNIQETYQPRARAEGKNFTPDPPTPGPVSEQKNEEEKQAFNANRDSHYANMYQEAIRRAKEEADQMQAEDSVKTAVEKIGSKEDTPAASKRTQPEPKAPAEPVNVEPQRSTETALESGSPLYENLETMTSDLPPPPPYTAREKVQIVASKIVKVLDTGLEKVRTALDKTQDTTDDTEKSGK